LKEPQAKLIAEIGGQEINDECEKIIKKRGGCPLYVGECVYTKGYELLCKWVIHSVGP
jgi:O-acetyl-ADP-ribose deacetylase (regulator of RNase III)